MAESDQDVYCTLLMSDSYLPGVAVLARSLRDAGTKKQLAILVTLDSLLPSTVAALKDLYDHVIPVDKIANPALENLLRLDRMDLRFAFTKIALWRQQQFRKIVYIDADVVALRAPEELFNIESQFAAAPDIGWPDCFNSGVMVLTPSMSEYWSLHTLASSGTSFDGADQGLLNEYFSQRPWHRLSFTYNCTPSSSYQYEPAYRHFRSGINMVHFIGKDKPWTQGREALSSAGPGVYKELLGKWWATYDRHYKTARSSSPSQVVSHIRLIQQYVNGEQIQDAIGWGAAWPRSAHDSDTSTVSMEEPMMDPREAAEAIDQGHVEPTSTIEQRRFSAPQMEWDATRSAPPGKSKPEAEHFTVASYEMSADRGLFHPPSYPEPPKDMYYKVPETKPAFYQAPKPLFPWEKHKQTPSRVFPDDTPPSPPREREQLKASTPQVEQSSKFSAQTNQSTSSDPWNSFTRTNAWDDVTSIDTYVRALKESQRRRPGPIQILHPQPQDTQTSTKDFGLSSPLSPPVVQRRESLILTDFPTEIDRPSLPVTPAPITRHFFWGEERSDATRLPTAEGVPEQAEWNPLERLEELRQSSFVAAEELEKGQRNDVPSREEVPSSVNLQSSAQLSTGEAGSSGGLSSSTLTGQATTISTPWSGVKSGSTEASSSRSGAFTSVSSSAMQTSIASGSGTNTTSFTSSGSSSETVRKIMEERTVPIESLFPGPSPTARSTSQDQDASKPRLAKLETREDKGGLFDEYSIA